MGEVETEFERVCVSVPSGFVKDGMDLVIGKRKDGDVVHGKVYSPDGKEWYVVQRPKKLKPDWNPPRMKKGWVTWDEVGWYWWPDMPRAKASDGWVGHETLDTGDAVYFDDEAAMVLGAPDCDGYEWSNCIWEVGNG